MPVVVDHGERREAVIAVATRILIERGLPAVTVREVARGAGFSTAVVSHYFRDKDELLALIFQRSVEHAVERADKALKASGGDLKSFIVPTLPLDEAGIGRWRVWLAYIAADRTARLAEVLRALDARGELVAGLDHVLVAQEILAMIMGLALQVLFAPEDWPAARQLAMVDTVIAPFFRSAQPDAARLRAVAHG